MRRQVVKSVALLGLALATAWCAPSEARAAGWASGMFRESSHDFGAVPRGAKVHHTFVFTNRLSEPLTVVNVRASCGCTTGWAHATIVNPGQNGAIEAEMDTRNFVGRKETVLYVSLISASGREAEVRLGVGSTILSDIVLNPGSADFGLISRGQTPSLEIAIDRVGMPQWRVQRMVSTCPAIDATLQETRRDGNAVSYQLRVTIKPDAPAGVIRDEIRLVSNDPASPIFPIQVTGSIKGDLTASPARLALGQANSAAGVQGKVLVRASRPFVVKGVEGIGEGFHAEVDSAEARPVHLLTIRFKPEESTLRGDLNRAFRIHTDLANESPVDVAASLRVEP